MKGIYIYFLLPFLLVFLTSCTKETHSNAIGQNDIINVVTTTTMLTDLAKTIGGDKVEVTGLMGPGIDPHQFEATAGNVSDMENADMIIYNGLHLEGKMGEVFQHMDDSGKNIVSMEDCIDKDLLIPVENNNQGIYDPHIWFDLHIWAQCAQGVAYEFAKYDPENAEYYEENFQNYKNDLIELDSYIKKRAAELPEEKRVLITAHDAFEYFGREYGFQVIGLQGINTNAEISTSDINKLADFIALNQVKAIFVETSVPTKTMEALQDAVTSRGFNVEIGGKLYSDSIGGVGSGAETYIFAYKHNVDAIVNALT